LGFTYLDGHLHCDGVSLQETVSLAGTPFYCYSGDAIRESFERYRRNFPADRAMVCFAVKANSNQSVLQLLGACGAGADVVSGGELKRALAAGIPADRIVFSSVAKTEAEMVFALEQGIFQFNVESEPELERLDEVARSLGTVAPAAFRVNPDIDAGTHEKITTGKAVNKFGIPMARAGDVYRSAARMAGIRVQGIAMHIGSQLTDLEPFRKAFGCLAELARGLLTDGHDICVLDIGGGLGIDYRDGAPVPPSLEDYAESVRNALGPLGCRIVVEPGRSIVGEAGVLVSEVLYVKEGEGVRFAIIDAGMNDLMRPSLYGAYHEISPLVQSDGPLMTYDVVGPICETGDTFLRGVELPELRPGDLVAFRNAGAYGAVMSGTYNTRALVPEIMVRDGTAQLVRRRVTPDEIIALDL
jgi:diaminopimelate decarboxylase